MFWPHGPPREQQPPAAPHLAQTFPTALCPALAQASSAEPTLLVKVAVQVVPPACPQEHKALLTHSSLCRRAVAPLFAAQGHPAEQHFHFSPWRVCCGDGNRGASGKWGSELMRLILAPHPLWKLSQACFGNTAGIFMSGICKGIFILDLETTGPAARFRKHRGKKHETSER